MSIEESPGMLSKETSSKLFSERLIANKRETVKSCLFFALTSNRGGAICAEKTEYLSITRTTFVSCITENEGGAIFATYCELNINQSCFEYCFIGHQQDELFGNAVCLSNSNIAELNLTNLQFCGPSPNCCADSTVSLNSKTMNSNSVNFSQCNNYHGAETFESSSTSKAIWKNVNSIGGNCAHSFRVYDCQIDIKDFCWIGNIYWHTMLYVKSAKVTNSNIYPLGYAALCSGQVYFDNCKSNNNSISISGIIYQDNASYIKLLRYGFCDNFIYTYFRKNCINANLIIISLLIE